MLGGVLAASALLKLSSLESSRAGLASFGIRAQRTGGLVLAALIATELALAATVAAGSDLAALLAAALMLAFAGATLAALARGRGGEPCACFGPRSTVGWSGVARNLLLATAFAALPFVPHASPSTDGWLAIGLGAALLACAGLAVAGLGLAREVGMLRLQLGTQGALEIAGEGPDIGALEAELIARLSPNGAATGVAIFTSEGCHLCQTLEPAIENLGRDPRLAVGVFDEDADVELWRRLEIPGSPFAVALDRGGTVLAKGTFNNLAQLESVVATAERRRSDA